MGHWNTEALVPCQGCDSIGRKYMRRYVKAKNVRNNAFLGHILKELFVGGRSMKNSLKFCHNKNITSKLIMINQNNEIFLPQDGSDDSGKNKGTGASREIVYHSGNNSKIIVGDFM
jgi:hypothetical protein